MTLPSIHCWGRVSSSRGAIIPVTQLTWLSSAKAPASRSSHRASTTTSSSVNATRGVVDVGQGRVVRSGQSRPVLADVDQPRLLGSQPADKVGGVVGGGALSTTMSRSGGRVPPKIERRHSCSRSGRSRVATTTVARGRRWAALGADRIDGQRAERILQPAPSCSPDRSPRADRGAPWPAGRRRG